MEETMAKEVVITDYPKYTITDNGDVYSTQWGKRKKLKPQKATQSKKGYYQFRLFNKETPKGKLHYVHRLVYTQFVGEITDGHEIDHIDEDTSNNNINNIQLISRRGNLKRYNRKRYGGDLRESRDEVINDYVKLGTYKKVGEKWGKSEQVIYRTVKNIVHYKDYNTGKYSTRTYDKNINDEFSKYDLRSKKK